VALPQRDAHSCNYPLTRPRVASSSQDYLIDDATRCARVGGGVAEQFIFAWAGYWRAPVHNITYSFSLRHNTTCCDTCERGGTLTLSPAPVASAPALSACGGADGRTLTLTQRYTMEELGISMSPREAYFEWSPPSTRGVCSSGGSSSSGNVNVSSGVLLALTILLVVLPVLGAAVILYSCYLRSKPTTTNTDRAAGHTTAPHVTTGSPVAIGTYAADPPDGRLDAGSQMDDAVSTATPVAVVTGVPVPQACLGGHN
jgi:hypothetical protein